MESECCVCTCEYAADEGITCSGTSDGHFICTDCLCSYIKAECHEAGQYEVAVLNDTLDITSSVGQLPCPIFVSADCDCAALTEGDIMRCIHTDREAIVAFLGSNGRVAVHNAKQEELRAAALQEAIRAAESSLDRLRREVEEACFSGSTIRCPHCHTAAQKNDGSDCLLTNCCSPTAHPLYNTVQRLLPLTSVCGCVACMHMDSCPCGGSWCYCCGRKAGPEQCARYGGTGCDTVSIYIESNPGWEHFALDGQSAGQGNTIGSVHPDTN